MENSETMQQQGDKRSTLREHVLALLADSAEKISVLSKLNILRITKIVYYERIENFEIEVEVKGNNYPTEFKLNDTFSEWDEVAEANFRGMLDSQVSNVRKEMETLKTEIGEMEKKGAEIESALKRLNTEESL